MITAHICFVCYDVRFQRPLHNRHGRELSDAHAQLVMAMMLAALVAPAGYLPGLAAASPVHSALRGAPMTPALVMRTGDGPERSRKHRSVRGVATTLALIAANLVAPQLGGAEGRLASMLGARSAIAAPVISTGARKKAKLALKVSPSLNPIPSPSPSLSRTPTSTLTPTLTTDPDPDPDH